MLTPCLHLPFQIASATITTVAPGAFFVYPGADQGCAACDSSMGMLASTMTRLADQLLRFEGLILLLVAPLLLFPNPTTPWAALLLVGLWPLRWWRRGHLSRRTPLDWALAVLMVMLLVGYAQAIDRTLAEPRFWSMFLSLAAFYTVVNTVTSARQVWQWAFALVALGLGVALLGLVGTNWFTDKVVDLGAVYSQLPRLLDGTLGPWRRGFHPNEVGGTLAMFLPLTLALWWGAWRLDAAHGWPSRARTVQRFGLTVVLVAQGTVLLLTQSRAALLSLALALLVLAVVRQRRLVLVVPVVLAGAVWLLQRWGGQLDALPGTNPANLIGRADLWGRALLAIHDFPLAGIGLGMFRRLALLYYPFFEIDPVLADVGHAHNVFLQMTLDFGIFGLIAYVAVVLLTLAILWRLYRTLAAGGLRLLTAGVGAGFLAMLFFGVLDAMMPVARPSFTLWLFSGLIVAVYNLQVRPHALEQNARPDATSASLVSTAT
jgi:hypothetical protein